MRHDIEQHLWRVGEEKAQHVMGFFQLPHIVFRWLLAILFMGIGDVLRSDRSAFAIKCWKGRGESSYRMKLTLQLGRRIPHDPDRQEEGRVTRILSQLEVQKVSPLLNRSERSAVPLYERRSASKGHPP